MKLTSLISLLIVGSLLLFPQFTAPNSACAAAADAPQPLVLIVVGPSQHPPGTHEVPAGARVMEYMLEHAEGVPPVAAEIVDQWPQDKRVLDNVKSIVFTGDIFPGETLPNPEAIKADLTALMARGCGIVCVHYATGLRAQNVTADGDHPLLRWMGGYFATGCEHHRSVARVVTATLTPAEVRPSRAARLEGIHLRRRTVLEQLFRQRRPGPERHAVGHHDVAARRPRRKRRWSGRFNVPTAAAAWASSCRTTTATGRSPT